MTYEEIYKIYKHGGSYKDTGIPPEKIYRTLRKNGLEVFMVIDWSGRKRIHIYEPIVNKFNLLY